MKLSRRWLVQSLVGAGGLAAVFSLGRNWRSLVNRVRASAYPVSFVGPDPSVGHKLRNTFVTTETTKSPPLNFDVVIVGGGVSGLSAARHLNQTSNLRVALVELETECGGNSRSLQSAVTAYPLGAHYLPLVNPENVDLQSFLKEIKVITSELNGRLVYDERFLCSDPEERLQVYGRWLEGLTPKGAMTNEDLELFNRFSVDMRAFRLARGLDGKPLFQIPVDHSSSDPKTRALDQQTFAEWLHKQYGKLTPAMDWYLNYCMQDDYGLAIDQVSAWAGIHYFASRRGEAANADHDNVLTWPAGNGFLVNALHECCRQKSSEGTKSEVQFFNRHLVSKIHLDPNGEVVVESDQTSFKAKQVIVATPRFVAQRILPAALQQDDVTIHYAPWLVTNIHLKSKPVSKGFPLSWDNVRFRGQDLGYIVATHQHLERERPETVFTFYKTFPQWTAKEAREKLLKMSPSEVHDLVLPDLLKMHADLEPLIEKMEFTRWGHGMVAPVPGFVWGKARQKLLEQKPPIFFAHSDQSGLSLFEEAFERGLIAAREVVKESLKA